MYICYTYMIRTGIYIKHINMLSRSYCGICTTWLINV